MISDATNLTLVTIALAVCSFFLGAIPTGYIIGRAFFGTDIRHHGSGNIGATNVGRTLGKNAGIYTLVGDMLKGMIPALAGMLLATPHKTEMGLFCGFCAVCGHCFSPFLKFNGGKGVATSLGVIAVATPLLSPITILVFVIALGVTKYVSVASMVASASVPLLMLCQTPFALGFSRHAIILAACMSLLLILRHRENITRLYTGTEFKLSRKEFKQQDPALQE